GEAEIGDEPEHLQGGPARVGSAGPVRVTETGVPDTAPAGPVAGSPADGPSVAEGTQVPGSAVGLLEREPEAEPVREPEPVRESEPVRQPAPEPVREPEPDLRTAPRPEHRRRDGGGGEKIPAAELIARLRQERERERERDRDA
ncbi:MAG: MMPL family transporter, partial [Dietzia sp.]|nr:MMPL family transporter [Dietzia sp.]